MVLPHRWYYGSQRRIAAGVGRGIEIFAGETGCQKGAFLVVVRRRESLIGAYCSSLFAAR